MLQITRQQQSETLKRVSEITKEDGTERKKMLWESLRRTKQAIRTNGLYSAVVYLGSAGQAPGSDVLFVMGYIENPRNPKEAKEASLKFADMPSNELRRETIEVLNILAFAEMLAGEHKIIGASSLFGVTF